MRCLNDYGDIETYNINGHANKGSKNMIKK